MGENKIPEEFKRVLKDSGRGGGYIIDAEKLKKVISEEGEYEYLGMILSFAFNSGEKIEKLSENDKRQTIDLMFWLLNNMILDYSNTNEIFSILKLFVKSGLALKQIEDNLIILSFDSLKIKDEISESDILRKTDELSEMVELKKNRGCFCANPSLYGNPEEEIKRELLKIVDKKITENKKEYITTEETILKCSICGTKLKYIRIIEDRIIMRWEKIN